MYNNQINDKFQSTINMKQNATASMARMAQIAPSNDAIIFSETKFIVDQIKCLFVCVFFFNNNFLFSFIFLALCFLFIQLEFV